MGGEIKILSALTALCIAILVATGRVAPQVMVDTGPYLKILSFPEMLAQSRLPLYGWIVAVIDLGGGDHAMVPFVQIATYLMAAWLVVAELRRYGLSSVAGLSVGAALLFANALLLDAAWVLPELLSITCALVAVAGTVRLADPRPPGWAWLLVGVGTGCAYVLKPGLLPLIVTLPALHLCLTAIRGDPSRIGRAVAILGMAAAPFVIIATLRAVTVGDPNIVSFGGFQMSGMATLMLSDDVVARLPDDLKPDAMRLLAARRAGEDSGHMIGIPRNAEGVRSFPSAALGYFDVLARTHDDVLYSVVFPTLKPDESWIDFNRRLMRFSLAVVRAAPDRYAAWIVGASTRLLGRSVATNLPAALALIVIAIAWPWRLLATRQIGPSPVSHLDVPVMTVLAVLWLASAGALSVLVTFPVTRYVDTASLLVAAPLIYWAALLLAPRAAGSAMPAPSAS